MPPAKKTAKPRKRRTQAERSDAMRARLLEATLAALLDEGHAATSVTSIVKRAGVSRGAHLHHYPSKEALLNDAAEYLMRDAYRRLGRVLLDTANSEERLETLLAHTWAELFGAPVNQIYTELLVASRRDKSLERVLRRLAKAALEPMNLAARHFFESTDPVIKDVNIPFMLNQWLMRGMALDIGLVGDPAKFEDYLVAWRHMLSCHIKPRSDVQGLPARPASWDLHWPDLLRGAAGKRQTSDATDISSSALPAVDASPEPPAADQSKPRTAKAPVSSK